MNEYGNCLATGMKLTIAELERNNNILMEASRSQEMRHRKALADKDADIERLKALCGCAADALEVYLPTTAGGTRHPFIAELRKAAE